MKRRERGPELWISETKSFSPQRTPSHPSKPNPGSPGAPVTQSKQNQHQKQGPFTTEDTESAHPKKSKPGSLRAPDTEEGKTMPLVYGRMGQVADEQEQMKKQANALAVKLARTYEELTRLLERNPAMKREITEGTTKEEKVYQRLKQRLKMADMAPRCRWVRQDGTSCRSPQMKQHIYCFAHKQMAEARTLLLLLPPPEDANAIQIGLIRIQKAMIEDTISTKKAGLLLYSMQLALTNVGQTTFGKAKDEEMVRDTVDEEVAISEEAFSNQHSAFSEWQNQNPRPFTAKAAEDAKESKQNQHQRTFTTEGTEATKEIRSSGHRDIWSSENQNLPRMDAHDRGLESGLKPVEWRPTPDMYRTDTPEGREAYEACLRRMTATRPGAERRPPQPVIPPQPAQKRRGPGAPVIGPEDGAQCAAPRK
jgi:hypothetical protein